MPLSLQLTKKDCIVIETPQGVIRIWRNLEDEKRNGYKGQLRIEAPKDFGIHREPLSTYN